MIKKFRSSYVVLSISLMLAILLSITSTTSAEAATFPLNLRFNLVTGGLTKPVFVTNASDGSNRLFILEQGGAIRVFKNGSLLSTPFLNLAGSVPNFTGAVGERGLLGLAFDPSYETNGTFYVTYTANTNDTTFPYAITLARYHVSSGNANLANASSRQVLLSVPKKYNNHNGGMIAFGAGGYLYMSTGDGGSIGDPDNNAQNLHSLLGKLLRLDVHTTPPAGQQYVIPPSNPFFASTDSDLKKEIWSYGLRNPWRWSFDRSTGNLYIGDVGQDRQEEIDFQSSSSTGGQNYGWHVLEGNLCYSPASNCGTPARYVAPVTIYNHGDNDSFGCSVTGGYIYRGDQFLALKDVYFYGDFCTGKLLGLIRNSNNTWTSNLLASTTFSISSFGEDERGDLYLADYRGGKVYQLRATIFADVPMDYWAWRFIERLYAAGVTTGCQTSPRMFCPTDVVTREQAAIFLLRGKHGSTYVPPQATGVFEDVPQNYWAADWIEQLAAEGITSGCRTSPRMYCPTDPVTREQIAVLLLRAKHGSNYVPPAATGVFDDVPANYWAAAWIEQLAAEGITTGCGGGNYCPRAPVTRDQMAVFLVRTFNLP